MPGGRKAVKSKNEESLVFSRGGVTEVTPPLQLVKKVQCPFSA